MLMVNKTRNVLVVCYLFCIILLTLETSVLNAYNMDISFCEPENVNTFNTYLYFVIVFSFFPDMSLIIQKRLFQW